MKNVILLPVILIHCVVFSQVGINTTTPKSTFEVNGSSTNTSAFNAAASYNIDFGKSNLAYTTASINGQTPFVLNNIKDGGTYTLVVKAVSNVGTATFSGTQIESNLPFNFHYVNNGPSTLGQWTMYTFIVMGEDVISWMTKINP